jgi:hypothetical protein
VSFHTREQIRELLQGMETVYFYEEEREGLLLLPKKKKESLSTGMYFML